MLQITIPSAELWDEENEMFVYTKEQKLQLEHSLVSISKWESKWCKFFLSKQEKTFEETIDYIKCMTITQNVDPKVYDYLSIDNFNEINRYIESPMTATTFTEEKIAGTNREQISSELIYYWMIALNIPFECQKWHLNRLLTLIRLCNIKNQPPKKRSKRDIMKSHDAIRAANRKRFGTRG